MNKECKEIIEVAEGPSICVDETEAKERATSAVREESGYGIKVWIKIPYDQALSSTLESLKREGFNIVNMIDMRKLLADAISVEFPRYSIIGVCIPDLTFHALEHDRDIGLLIPCNVVVYEHADGSIVEAVDPIALFAMAEGRGLRDIALDVKQRLQTAVDHVAAGVV